MTGGATTTTHSISFGKHTILFNLKYSNRKTLAISVNPDLSVSVTAPKGKDIALIKTKVHKRATWILEQQGYFRSFLPNTTPRQYVSGESHYYLGRQYRLKVISAEVEEVKLIGGYIHIWTKEKGDARKVKSLLDKWLLSHARAHFRKSMERCWEKFRRYATKLPQLQIRRMSKRWGSFNPSGLIYLNPDLIKAPRHCIDYVMMHELCHLKEANHGRQFYEILRAVMPDWEQRKRRLEKIDIGLHTS